MTEPRQHRSAPGDGFVYLVPHEAVLSYDGNEMTLREVWIALWRGKWIIAATTIAAALLSIGYALTATKWYAADVLLAPAQQASSPVLSGSLGSLAGLAGVNFGDDNRAEAVASLRSRDFTREFIEEQNLTPILLQGLETASPAPDIRDAIRYFDDNVRRISVDRTTGLVTLIIEWKSPDLAAQWANLMVDRLNDRMRRRALEEAEENVEYLQTELANTSIVTLQQSIGRLLETELQKLMLARGNKEFAFRIIDRAQVPNSRSRPQRTLIVVFSTMLGGMLGVLVVLTVRSLRNAQQDGSKFVIRSLEVK